MFLSGRGVEAKIFRGNALGMQWLPVSVVWWKKCGDAVNTVVCRSNTRGKEIRNKFMGPNVTFWDCESRKIQTNILQPAESTPVLRIARFQLFTHLWSRSDAPCSSILYEYSICHKRKFGQVWGPQLPYQKSQENTTAGRHPFRPSTTTWNKNLAIANRSRVSCAHNTLRASISIKWHRDFEI